LNITNPNIQMQLFQLRFLSAFFLLLLSYSNAQSQQNSSLTQIENFGDNPGNLKMFVHENDAQKITDPKPLVIVLHGCGQNAQDVATLTGWNKLSDSNKFIVLYPQQKMINNISACFNWFNNKDIENGKGENESIFEMISYMQLHYKIDSTKIFITGLSAGAAMSVVMLATHPSLFKSGAIFAGCAYKLATNPLAAFSVMGGNKKISKDELVKNISNQNQSYKGKYPSLIIYQGLNDQIVNHKNAALLITQWAGINKCDSIPTKTETSFMSVPDITRFTFNDINGKPVVLYYEIKKLGHQLLIKPGDAFNEGGKKGSYGVDKNFHSTYQTAKDFGILQK
jgi:poly(hydroxyalkanoate) depolymerase family esterase